MKIVTVIGARPQFVKAAAVSRILAQTPQIAETLVHTGQHFDGNMSQVFFDELEIALPAYNLGVSGGTHGAQTGRMLEKIEEVLLEEVPDAVLVYGDTNSTMAGALAAAKLHIPVIHVEAGLRSFNKGMPEEINRIMTDHLSDLLFVPTDAGIRNLQREGITLDKCCWVGDVMYDASLHFGERAEATSTILERLGLESRQYLLATLHRAENTDVPLRLNAILEGLAEAAREMPIVLPLHPRTRKIIENNGWLRRADSVHGLKIIDPVGYLDMIMLEKNASLVATDSGGVQKEAFFHRVPCITLRDETEWTELVELGWNTVISPSNGGPEIAAAIRRKLGSTGFSGNPYGNGDAAHRIAVEISKRYRVQSSLKRKADA